jgi:hypothetical protein
VFVTALWISFVLFGVLTLAFAVTLLWRLIPRAPKPDVTTHAVAVSNIVPQGPNAESLKAIADAISTVLKALGDFGTKLDAFGPAAMLGVFTLIFALLALASAWLAR